jgi:hypothetical protein
VVRPGVRVLGQGVLPEWATYGLLCRAISKEWSQTIRFRRGAVSPVTTFDEWRELLNY